MNHQSYTQTLPNRVYRTPRHPQEESPLKPANGKAAAGTTNAADRLIGQRYLLRARCGRGRLGDIYEARDESNLALGVEWRVAIQLLDEQVAAMPHFADEFARGAAALQAISHPHIVKLLDFGRDGDQYFLVRELIDGASLRFVLDDVMALSTEETIAIVRAVGDALRYLHAKDMVHGDLGPENVLVTYDYEVKLLDVVPSSWLSADPGDGEEAELRARTNPDIRDDVYDLACLTYELLAGMHPYNANTPLEAARAGLEPMPIDGLSPRQWQALAGGLALHREHRTPTVAEFLDEFGITGVERLRSTVSDDAKPHLESAPQAAIPASAVAAERLTPPPPPAWPTRVVTAERFAPRRAKSPGTAGKLLSLLVVAGLGALAFVYHDRLRDGAAELMAAIDAKFRDAPVARPGKATGEPDVAQPSGFPVPTDTAQPSGIAAPPGDAIAQSQAPRIDDSTDAPQAAATGAGEPAASEPRFSFAQPFVTVSESQVAARIVIQRSGDATGQVSVIWWTSEDTAIAGEDYADLGLRVEKFARGERSRAVYIPLVNDTVVESTRSFNVYLGRDDPAREHLEPFSGIRVEIVDDD